MNSVSKNIYIDKSNDIVNKYNNKYHNTIKTKPVDVKPSTCINSSKEIIEKDPKFKLVIPLEYQNIKKHICKRLCSKLV